MLFRGRSRRAAPALLLPVLVLGATAQAAPVAPRGSVATSSIRNAAVTSAKLARGAVRDRQLAGRAVTTPKLATRAVTTRTLATRSVTARVLAANAVTTLKLGDGQVTGAKVANNTLTGLKVIDGSLSGADLANDSLTGLQIADGSLTGADLANGTLTGLQIGDGSLTGTEVAPDSLTGQQIDEATLTGIDASTLGGLDPAAFQKRVTGTCGSGQSVNAVNANGTVGCAANGGPPSGAAGGDLTGTYPAPTIANGAVDSAKISNGTIGSADIDQTQVQRRLSGTCLRGQTISSVSATGAVTCASPVAGIVQPNATLFTGSGVTVGHPNTGEYTLTWSNGTFNVNVAPFIQPILDTTGIDTQITEVDEGTGPVGPGGLFIDVQFKNRSTGDPINTYFSYALMPGGTG